MFSPRTHLQTNAHWLYNLDTCIFVYPALELALLSLLKITTLFGRHREGLEQAT
jgi:hypothetical protein